MKIFSAMTLTCENVSSSFEGRGKSQSQKTTIIKSLGKFLFSGDIGDEE
jgi:hypothetical protein